MQIQCGYLGLTFIMLYAGNLDADLQDYFTLFLIFIMVQISNLDVDLGVTSYLL